MNNISHLECSRCGQKLDAHALQSVCPSDGAALLVRYAAAALEGANHEALTARPATMWRYREVLPLAEEAISLGEGYTPLLASRTHPHVWIKDEGANPTGSFESRSMSVAVTALKHFGVKKVVMPSAGNAASALAAYAAAAGIEAQVFLPQDVPAAIRVECTAAGADVVIVDGALDECVKRAQQASESGDAFNLAAMREPYRLEGRKTMGYELAEQLGWRLPDAILWPAGAGMSLVALWKAFDEMEEMGWIGAARPKMIAVQAAGCAPIVQGFAEAASAPQPWPHAASVASGLRVTMPAAGALVLDILRSSHGTAVAVSDDEILAALVDWARREGLLASPEGAATFAAYEKLRAVGVLGEEEEVVLFNTASALKSLDVLGRHLGINGRALPKSRSLGGIIQPY